MLQQTQVSTVIPYFEKFIQTFPDIETLARANIDHVLGLWSGLGYYARARNLHKTAKKITLDLRCEFPSNLEALMELPGIGQSTAGAILSIAMDTSTPILDGNVKRVLARFHTLSGYPENTRVKQLFWELAEQHTPKTQFQIYTQAIMDLGATVCTRSSPNCEYCPVKANCKAFKKGTIAEYPNKKQPKEKPKKAARFFLIYNNNGEVLVEKRNSKGVWQGLWGALQRPLETEPIALCEQLGFKASTIMDHQIGNSFRHTFSHYHLQIEPVYISISLAKSVVINSNSSMMWTLTDNLLNDQTIGISKADRLVFEAFIKVNDHDK